MKPCKVALIGNQNSGKSTLFNMLTGSHQHVGNFPGITVEKKEGICEANKNIHIIDLPGVYSLSMYANDELLATSYLLEEKPDAIINIVDATNLERNLYLTMQLLELEIPIILALNMIDVVKKQQQFIDMSEISKRLGIPVVGISAKKKQGLDYLLKEIENLILHNVQKPVVKYKEGDIYIKEVMQILSSSVTYAYPLKYSAIQTLENSQEWIQKLNLTAQQQLKITAIKKVIEKKHNQDIESYIINMRYQRITSLCHSAVSKNQEDRSFISNYNIDAILTHKYLGIPIFLTIMLSIFYATFHLFGTPLQRILDVILQQVSHYIIDFLSANQVAPWLLSLLQDGIFAGIRSVLSFLPIVILLFFFLSLLEDSGYMARVAFLMDALLQKMGVSGTSFVPLILGFGCSVPAILATRSLPSERDRRLTILLIPFISCSAKFPIYSIIVKTFFADKAAVAMLLMYSIGIFVAIITALVLKSTIFIGESVPFLMELPTYRMPTIRNIWQQMNEKVTSFITRVFTVIFLASITIWFLQNFNLQLQYIDNANESILAYIGNSISWLFKPIGSNDWRLATSLVTGVIAKESVVSTLTIVTASINKTQLAQTLTTILTPSSALAFLTFTILYVPCIATIATIYKELQSLKETVLIVIFHTGVAYVVAYIIYVICIILT